MNNSKFTIHKATINDLNDIIKISKQTFIEAFGADNTESNMALYINTHFSISEILKELNSQDSKFYLGYSKNQLVGYLKLNFQSTIAGGDLSKIEIERIYVYSDFYGTGIGQMLLDHAISIAHKKHISCIWLGVWEHNLRAIRFYHKNGFTAYDTHIFRLGTDNQTDILMQRKLNKSE